MKFLDEPPINLNLNLNFKIQEVQQDLTDDQRIAKIKTELINVFEAYSVPVLELIETMVRVQNGESLNKQQKYIAAKIEESLQNAKANGSSGWGALPQKTDREILKRLASNPEILDYLNKDSLGLYALLAGQSTQQDLSQQEQEESYKYAKIVKNTRPRVFVKFVEEALLPFLKVMDARFYLRDQMLQHLLAPNSPSFSLLAKSELKVLVGYKPMPILGAISCKQSLSK